MTAFRDFRPLSGITTRMLQARNYCSTGSRRPSRFLEGTAIPNSVIRRELDTPTPDEEHKAWIAHVMNTVAPRIISRLQQPQKRTVIIEPAPFDRSALPTVSEMRIQKEREENWKIEKEAQRKLEALLKSNNKHGERCSIAFGKRSTQECIAEAISRSKEIQDIITAKVLGQSFRSGASMEIIRESSDTDDQQSQGNKSSKRGKNKKKTKKSDSEATNEDKTSSPKEDRVLQLIHSIKAGVPADISQHRHSLSNELRLMEQYRQDLEQRTMSTPSGSDPSSSEQPEEAKCSKSPPSSPAPQQTKPAKKPIARPARNFRGTPANHGVQVTQRPAKKSPERCCRPTITPHITNVGTDTVTQQALKADKYNLAPRVIYN